MTNKDKFLKDGVSVEEFIEDMFSSHYAEEVDRVLYLNRGSIDYWLKTTSKPTLTEDEIVILKNLQPEITLIGRNGANELFIAIDSTNEFVDFFCYDHLFQFIKERRRI